MPHKVYINGKLISENNASVSVLDRSYLYGEGVFETIRAYNGRPAFCDMHYHRLKANCEKLKIELPLDQYAFEHAVMKVINANKLRSAYVRVTVSPIGLSMGIGRPEKRLTNVVIIARRFEGRREEVYKNGAKVIAVQSVYADDPEMAEIKSTSYITKMIARQEIADEKADEGLLSNREGFVTEGSASNLFVVKGRKLFSPPLSDGCLPGITRFVAIGLAETLRIPFKEEHLVMEDLKAMDEIFLTGTTSEIMPVKEIIGLTKKTKVPGPVTLELSKAYSELVANSK